MIRAGLLQCNLNRLPAPPATVTPINRGAA